MVPPKYLFSTPIAARRLMMNSVDRLLPPALPYLLPYFLFALVTYCGPVFEVPLFINYPLKTILVAASLAWFIRYYKTEIRFQMDWVAIAVGILVFLVWVGLDKHYPQMGPIGGSAVDPAAAYSSSFFLIIRIVGAVLVVPLMEELFWRSFALRFLIDFHFVNVRLGQFSWFSFAVVSGAFGLSHNEWLPGIFAGCAYAALLYRSKNLFSSILAHGVTNLLLGIYVIKTESWYFW